MGITDASFSFLASNMVIEGKYQGKPIMLFRKRIVAISVSLLKNIHLTPENVKSYQVLSEEKSFISTFLNYKIRILYTNNESSVLYVNRSIKEALDEILAPVIAAEEKEKLIRSLLIDLKVYTDLINKTEDVSSFIHFYDNIIQTLEQLVSIGANPEEMEESPSYALDRMKEEFQWHMCDAIERSKDYAIREIKGKYRNSKEFKVKTVERFKSSLEANLERFSADTVLFFEKALDEVVAAAGLPVQNTFIEEKQVENLTLKDRDPLEVIRFMETRFEAQYEFCYENLLNFSDCKKMYERTVKEFDCLELPLMAQVRFEQLCEVYKEKLNILNITNPFVIVDAMEGHEFEHWCAKLLEQNGFTNVEVTKGSGDQGVDVLAVKDEIRYAFQCKCYSSNLGNTPVQQIHAGKTLYGCQVGVVMTNRYFTAGAKELASATGVLLWDRDKLQKMIKATY